MAIEEITKLVEESVTSEVFGVWFLIGAALVFFMQAGFAMVETGFTRAKNAGNIIMKNLMDFCIGTVVFVLLGFSLMMAEDYVLGIFGVPNLEILTDFGAFLKGGNAPSFVFNLVFCATAATIVSGSMAERTKFVSYCIYSGIISLFVYPIEAGWVWNSQGWLVQLGFHDFAGSAAIHSVGGITALIGAIMVGPRLGKYVKDKAGKVKKVNAIPGHSITLGALGCFILWFGWYGFNGAAAWDGNSLASIFVTTTIAPAVATCTTMLYTWFKNGKPDVSMCLNGSLAGLVGVTAGCDAVDTADAKEVAARYNIEIRTVDLTPVKEAELKALDGVATLNAAALSNIAPRLRMLTLYAVAAAENRLVVGTGNRSEAYVGYFTKWGDGAHDFNPIADLTVTEIYEFLRYLDAPKCVIEKAPSAALFDGQTDETEMGVTYAELDAYLSGGDIPAKQKQTIERMHRISQHKRKGIAVYEE